MVSPAISQLLERVRLRFGLDVEVLDAALNRVYPDDATDLSRAIDESAVVRRSLFEALTDGRVERLKVEGLHYRLYPLRQSSVGRQAIGLLAIRAGNGDGLGPSDIEPWSDLARTVVETDLGSGETLADERLRSRRLTGAVQLVDYLHGVTDEAALGQAIVEAAAVWYDVDARIYRRDLSGEFIVDVCLPGVRLAAESHRLRADFAVGIGKIRRLTSTADLGQLSANQDAVLVPLGDGSGYDRILVLLGSVPVDAELVLGLLARVAAERFAAFANASREQARQAFDSILGHTERVPELTAVHLLQELARVVNASSGALTLLRRGQTRRIAAIGAAAAPEGVWPLESQFSTDRFLCVIPLAQKDAALLDLRPALGRGFGAEDALVARVCATALRPWLAGTLTSLEGMALTLDIDDLDSPLFLSRIKEELERARRFDLRLSLLLVEVRAPLETLAQLQEALRRELRGSDVTGAMGRTRIAAILTHTDALGLDNVVRRVRQPLADIAERLNLSDLKLGQAAISPDVRTADALLEVALRHAEPVIVH
jgi:hypothetical protein